jgi:hypothetical protein
MEELKVTSSSLGLRLLKPDSIMILTAVTNVCEQLRE